MRKDYDLRKRRQELGMSIRAAAAKARISPASVRAMETGLFHGKPITLKKLADALGIPVRVLMSDAEQKAMFGDVKVLVKMQAFCDEKKMTPAEVWAELKRLGRG
jgi:transcriptional regulator with XRE-family HTH domain